MNKVHLNEEQLQEYAIYGSGDTSVREHMAGCGHCQVHVRAYQILYSYIREAETPLADFKTEELIPERLPAISAEDRKEVRYLYSFLFGVGAMLIAVSIGFWGAIRWVFSGVAPLAIVIGLLLLSGILIAHLMELYAAYRKKLNALNME